MPTKIKILRKYWCPGWLPWQWIDICVREIDAWQYTFEWVIEKKGFGDIDVEGCEDSLKYSYSYFSIIPKLKSEKRYGVIKTFYEKLNLLGGCDNIFSVFDTGGFIENEAIITKKIRDTIKVNKSQSTLLSKNTHKVKYIPEDFGCNPNKVEVSKWVVENSLKITFTPSQSIGEMTWLLENRQLISDKGVFIIEDKATELLWEGNSENRDLEINFDIDKNNALSLTIDGALGNFNLIVALHIKLTSTGSDIGIVLYNELVSIDTQHWDGDEKYKAYIRCTLKAATEVARIKKDIETLINRKPGPEDPDPYVFQSGISNIVSNKIVEFGKNIAEIYEINKLQQ